MPAVCKISSRYSRASPFEIRVITMPSTFEPASQIRTAQSTAFEEHLLLGGIAMSNVVTLESALASVFTPPSPRILAAAFTFQRSPRK
jgi:hypothetical protein